MPDGVNDEQTAAVLLQGSAAQFLMSSTYTVGAVHEVLVHAAAEGMGLLLTLFVLRQGARVIAIVSTASKTEAARSAGADEVVRYDRDDTVE